MSGRRCARLCAVKVISGNNRLRPQLHAFGRKPGLTVESEHVPGFIDGHNNCLNRIRNRHVYPVFDDGHRIALAPIIIAQKAWIQKPQGGLHG